MMLALGMFVFMRQTLPYQSMQRSADYSWTSNSRVGKRDAFQYLGEGEDKFTLSGDLYPELTGGKFSMLTLMRWPSRGEHGRLFLAQAGFTGCLLSAMSRRLARYFLRTGPPEKSASLCH